MLQMTERTLAVRWPLRRCSSGRRNWKMATSENGMEIRFQIEDIFLLQVR